VDLDLLDPEGRQHLQALDVLGQEASDDGGWVGSVEDLGNVHKSAGSEDDWHNLFLTGHPNRSLDLLKQLGEIRLGAGHIGRQLGNFVVVVLVEPFGHVESLGVGSTTGHGKVGVERREAQLQEPIRDKTQHVNPVEDMVVESEVAHADHVNASVNLELNIAPEDCVGNLVESVHVSFPSRA